MFDNSRPSLFWIMAMFICLLSLPPPCDLDYQGISSSMETPWDRMGASGELKLPIIFFNCHINLLSASLSLYQQRNFSLFVVLMDKTNINS